MTQLANNRAAQQQAPQHANKPDDPSRAADPRQQAMAIYSAPDTLHAFTRPARALKPSGHPWLDELRRAGIARFEHVGFPTPRDEEWRYTNVAPIARTTFKLSGHDEGLCSPEYVDRFTFGGEAVSELVFVNGEYCGKLSRPGKQLKGAYIGCLATALKSEGQQIRRYLARHADINANPFIALNTGFLHDGAYIHLTKGTVLTRPIHLLFLSTSGADGVPRVSHPRVLVVAEPGVEASFVESYVGYGDGTYFTNAVTEVYAGPGARIDRCKVQQESPNGFHVATLQAHLSTAASFVSHSASLGSKLTRNDLNVNLAGEAAGATLNGLVIANDDQHVDNHTLMDHAEPNCPSHELYKYVLGGRASGVFKGKILVRPPAQKTDSKQSSKTLLLSDDAVMNSQPALEIYADDVKCTHGSTTGPVDEDMVFYLRSRGVATEAARHLLSYAFAADITRRIKVEPVRRRLEEYMAAQQGLPSDLRITDLGRHDEAHR